MSQDIPVFEVGQSGFQRYVIDNSQASPVLVEFMGVWSEPCVVMADAIHDLVVELQGQFAFARVDIDEQPQLSEQFSIQNVPTLLVFQKGEVVFRQEGQMQQDEIRVLLRGLGIVRESDELREQARNQHMQGNTQQAILLLTQAIKTDPSNTRIAMDMLQIFIDMNELQQAKDLYNRLPQRDRDSDMGKVLLGQLTFKDLAANTEGIANLSARLEKDENDHDARFDLALCKVAEHDYDNAIEELFIIMNTEPDYRDGAAKEMIITISNMLAPNKPEQAQGYRRRLANLVSG